MRQFAVGVGFLLFGLLIGGVGLASAGVGIGIPMIPIGAYLVIRGIRTAFVTSEEGTATTAPIFESTRMGGILFGVVLILLGIATSALLIGIPIVLAGIGLIVYKVFGDDANPSGTGVPGTQTPGTSPTQEPAAALSRPTLSPRTINPVPAQNPDGSIATPVATADVSETVLCPFCKETIKRGAIVCKHCRTDFRIGAHQDSPTRRGTMWLPIPSLVIGIITFVSSFDPSPWKAEDGFGFFVLVVTAFTLGGFTLSMQEAGRGMAIWGMVLAGLAIIVGLSHL